MDKDTEELLSEIKELRNEVKLLRAIVQSLMDAIAEENSHDIELEEALEESFPLLSTNPIHRYVS